MKRSSLVRPDLHMGAGCRFGERAIELVEEIDAAFPGMSVRIIGMSESQHAEEVFAVPTFALTRDVTSLGNPERADLYRTVTRLLEALPLP